MCEHLEKRYLTKGHMIEIFRDSGANNPRSEWDHAGKLTVWKKPCSHLTDSDAETSLAYIFSQKLGGFLWVSLDDSGADVADNKENANACIYISKADAIKEWGEDFSRSKVREYLTGELEEFSSWIKGEVYGYNVTGPNDEHVDSCWGFYGLEYCEEQALDAVKQSIEHPASVAAA